MAEAAETAAGLPAGTVRAQVAERPGHRDAGRERPGGVRKIGGVLGETDGLGTADPRAVIGLGVNADWAAADFPPDDRGYDDLAARVWPGAASNETTCSPRSRRTLEPRVDAPPDGRFDGAAWAARQVTTGREVRLETAERRPRRFARPVSTR